MKYVKIFLVSIVFAVAGCSSDVPGYNELELEGDEAIRQDVFEAVKPVVRPGLDICKSHAVNLGRPAVPNTN